MNCPKCNIEMKYLGESSTEVYYISPKGHNHDDNCHIQHYECKCGKKIKFSKINTCSVCDWHGATKCFCCGEKVAEWPEEISQEE